MVARWRSWRVRAGHAARFTGADADKVRCWPLGDVDFRNANSGFGENSGHWNSRGHGVCNRDPRRFVPINHVNLPSFTWRAFTLLTIFLPALTAKKVAGNIVPANA